MTSRMLDWTRRSGRPLSEDFADRREMFVMAVTGLLMAAGIGWGAQAVRQIPPVVLLVAVGLVAICGLLGDVFSGLAVGLVAAALIAGSQLLWHRSTASPVAYLATLILLFLLGGVTGTLSARLRRERRRQQRAEAMAVTPAAGSLGLLSIEDR